MSEFPSEPPSEPPVVLITGAAQGLGLATAQKMQSEGWCVHTVYRSSRGRATLEDCFGQEQVHQADLTEKGAAAQVVGQVLAGTNRLNGIVHAMGAFVSAAPSATTRDQILESLQNNFVSAVDLFHAARSPLRTSQGAAVLFGAAGLSGERGRQLTGAYTASKTALLVWMRSLALEEAPHGVRVNMVSPGIIPHEHAAPETQDSDRWARIPAGRPGEPKDVAAAVSWLLSIDASYVVGQNLEVAGGWLL